MNRDVATVRPLLDLTKSADTDVSIVAPGGVVRYTLTASVPLIDPNDSSLAVAPAHNVIVTDTLPLSLTPLGTNGDPLADGETGPSGGVWNAGARTLAFRLGEISPGSDVAVTFPTRVGSALAPGTVITNHASGDMSFLPEGSPDNTTVVDAASADSTLSVASAAPAVTKSTPHHNYDRWTSFNYTITLVIPANATYENLTVIDTLPPGVQFNSYQGASCVDEDGDPCLVAGIPTMARRIVSGATQIGWYPNSVPVSPKVRAVTFVYRARITSSTLGATFDNEVQVNWNVVDKLGQVTPTLTAYPEFDGETTTQQTVAYNRPIISLTKAADRESPWDYNPANGKVTYSVEVTNTGSLTATNLAIRDITYHLDIDLNSLVVTGTTCADCTIDGSGRLVGTLAEVGVGDTVTLTYEAVPTNVGRVTKNIDVLSFDDPEGTVYTNVINRSITIDVAEPELTITKTAPASVGRLEGTEIEFGFTVTNTSGATAYNPVVTDTVPGAWLCPAPGDTTAADLVGAGHGLSTTMAPGASVSFGAAFVICGTPPPGLQTNTATVNWEDFDDNRNAANQIYANSGDTDFSIIEPTLVLTKTPAVGSGATVDQTDTSTNVVRNGAWSVTVANTSSVPAFNLTVTDPLPDTMEYEIGSATYAWSDSSYSVSDTSVADAGAVHSDHATTASFVVGRLDAGESMTIMIPFKQNGRVPEPLTVRNEATVTAVNLTADLNNHADSGEYTILPLEPSPRVTKTVVPASGGIGQEVTYTIDVVLQGSAFGTHDIVVRDVLPDGMELIDEPPVAAVGPTAPWADNGWGATCVDGDAVIPGDDCSEVEYYAGYLGSRQEGDLGVSADIDPGETEVFFYIGDFADPPVGSTQDTIVRITLRARLKAQRANGEDIVDGRKDPIVNQVRPYFNRDDDRGGSASGDQISGWPSSIPDVLALDRANPRSRVGFDIVTP